MEEEQVDRIKVQVQSKLQIADEAYIGDKTAKVEVIVSAAAGEGAPYELLHAMLERHVRTFLIENWEQIRVPNNSAGSEYRNDYIDYDLKTCILFILWAWLHI